LTALGGYFTVSAQSPYFSIFDSFEKTPRPGEGKVIVHQPETVKMLVGTRIDSENIDVFNGKTYLKTAGYRLQVYSGNNQRTSKAEATSLQVKIKELYPDIDTYVDFYAPFWKLQVGNFRSYEEATLMLRDLRGTFPKVKNEIYVIEEEIRLPLE
jgi:hypothetical protein